MKEFRYIQNISTSGIGEIRIYEQIGVSLRNGKEIGISGSIFANEMEHLQNTCKQINIRFNSEGGGVMDGLGIFSSILNSKVPTKSFIDGIAASTAGWCALAANEVVISDIGSLMVHGATGPDTDMVNMANAMISKALSNRTGMTIEETTELMNKETFFKAFDVKDREYLLNKKIVNEVVSTGRKIKINKTDSAVNLAAIYNKLINPEKMSKLNTLLKLRNDAEESEQEGVVTALNARIAELEAKLAVIEADSLAKVTADNAALVVEATELVNKAVKEGKLLAGEAELTIANASKDRAAFSFISNFIGKLGNGKEAAKIFDVKNVKTPTGGAEDRTSWSFDDWSKKDDKGLNDMRNTNPEAFTELYNKQYKK